MPLTFKNLNELWAYVLTETLKRLGLTYAVICPGSRSTPLAMAFASSTPHIEGISILDERSAAFFALGIAKATGKAVVVVCSSGTAGANFYPAVIEATYSRVPLLILTADRPQEMRECHSGQTIDQLKLYGNYPNWHTELALPSKDMAILTYLRQTIIYAWERTLYPVPGVVHLNIPFRDPLVPMNDTNLITGNFPSLDSEEFFSHITSLTPALAYSRGNPFPYPQEWQEFKRGIIIAGVAQLSQPREYCQAIAQLSQTLKFPVLAEGLSPLRNYANLNLYLISTYDLILRNPELTKELTPEIVIQVGEMPTSKILRNWLNITDSRRWVIEKSDQNLDSLHGRTIHLRMSVEEIAREGLGGPGSNYSVNKYLNLWCDAEIKVRSAVDNKMPGIGELFESKVAWLMSKILPENTPLFIGNSMPVRDVEFFWKPNNLNIRPFFNRGANGIDGTLSTALGIAYRQQSSVMLTGDLALLHDTNGFLMRNKFAGHLTIVLINNNGGGIFEMLPIAKFDPPFEEFFATPQDINFAQLCTTYGIEHELITSWEHLQQKLNPLPNRGIRVLEVQTNRKLDAKWRQDNLGKFATDALNCHYKEFQSS
ncbi:MAG: 2-succinyl-5-enolpyruvyl-6-hydroxy-3-cyclohexene-1-carboxylic-acid synthase [Cyanomargarita calcarea GSE-NOS-MK-12-04C]|jgi:2-succinyl-5-enolpyruvyl-6-hydroxy-3-cyclohexene-1-carboxylate synthase|uniref:2-succinyl-5-enolpyruvyl-6-hydroxy-3-cyclohexene-1-carboxylate synthase n=1 Tax=Cyanomargarita calcarea GSE-NOS-MK-12-04C TaxID=2839659 RepID=A0A951QH29_9CYAN|nr:2-succinyl-5-enolpyruvyl-6-hydroxy-3-cyclohexene-1-carboxylic-acid synthase [Cyanomargarita calcarea GSE-NOS-MK-12-04C]